MKEIKYKAPIEFNAEGYGKPSGQNVSSIRLYKLLQAMEHILGKKNFKRKIGHGRTTGVIYVDEQYAELTKIIIKNFPMKLKDGRVVYYTIIEE